MYSQTIRVNQQRSRQITGHRTKSHVLVLFSFLNFEFEFPISDPEGNLSIFVIRKIYLWNNVSVDILDLLVFINFP